MAMNLEIIFLTRGGGGGKSLHSLRGGLANVYKYLQWRRSALNSTGAFPKNFGEFSHIQIYTIKFRGGDQKVGVHVHLLHLLVRRLWLFSIGNVLQSTYYLVIQTNTNVLWKSTYMWIVNHIHKILQFSLKSCNKKSDLV